ALSIRSGRACCSSFKAASAAQAADRADSTSLESVWSSSSNVRARAWLSSSSPFRRFTSSSSAAARC
ncbi:unnamed protein product, partial [Musa acuminata subsp. burmannicoides]